MNPPRWWSIWLAPWAPYFYREAGRRAGEEFAKREREYDRNEAHKAVFRSALRCIAHGIYATLGGQKEVAEILYDRARRSMDLFWMARRLWK